MPQHDPTPVQEGITDPVMPTATTIPEGAVNLPEEGGTDPRAQAYATRTERREAVVAGWRSDMMSHVTGVGTWIVLALAYLVVLVVAIMVSHPVGSPVIAVVATIVAWFAWWRLSRRDRHYRWLAALTPVVDKSTLQGEATILAASVDALSATLRNQRSDADTRLRAMQVVLSAAAPVMGRAGVTPQTASVEGYPSWPEVDRTEMPGQDGDFLSVHLIRLDATAKKMMTAMGEDVLFEETVARIAGEVVPPLRAMEAVVESERA